jgi:hypothetical protein
MNKLSDYPKTYCPFVRKTYKVNKDDWKKHGRKLQLRSPDVYLVTPEVTPGFEWVFEDKNTIAVEKLDGTNVKLETENGRLVSLYNRKNPIDMLDISGGKGRTAIVEAIFMAVAKKYIERDGVQAGEVIGKYLQGNPYNLDGHIWYPFEKANKHLSYRSWHEHERTYENLSSWFKDFLFSRFATKRGDKGIMAEGVIFYNQARKDERKEIYRAKLRRDMFSWFYDDKIEIYYE